MLPSLDSGHAYEYVCINNCNVRESRAAAHAPVVTDVALMDVAQSAALTLQLPLIHKLYTFSP